MCFHLKQQLDIRTCKATDLNHRQKIKMKQQYVKGFVVFMVYCFLKGPHHGGKGNTKDTTWKLCHCFPNNPFSFWIAYPLLKVAKNLFGADFSLKEAQDEKPRLFIQRLRAQSKEFGIYSIAALNEMVSMRDSFGSGLFLAVHHLATLISTKYKFNQPEGRKDSHIYFFIQSEYQYCKNVTHGRIPLYVDVAGKPFVIKPLVKDRTDDPTGALDDPDA
jgi:hypothetical protein